MTLYKLYQQRVICYLINYLTELIRKLLKTALVLFKIIRKLRYRHNKLSLLLVLLVVPFFVSAQIVTWAFHTDLPATQLLNSTYKTNWNYAYASKLKEIKDNREKTLQYLVFIENVQSKIFKALTNVDDAIKDGKTLWALSKKMPEIFSNLEKSVELAADKPYMLIITGDLYNVFYQRCVKLTGYLENVLLKSDEQLLIDPVTRHQLVYQVYSEVNVLYQLSRSILDQYRLKGLQDAVDKVIPASTFYNVDKMLVQDILRKIKF